MVLDEGEDAFRDMIRDITGEDGVLGPDDEGYCNGDYGMDSNDASINEDEVSPGLQA